MPYFGLEGSRLRYFGGSSNHWDNWCGEFNPIDYRTRAWVPSSGWPFGPAELAPYYDRARPICGLRPRRSNEEMWASLGIDLSLLTARAWNTISGKLAQDPLRRGLSSRLAGGPKHPGAVECQRHGVENRSSGADR